MNSLGDRMKDYYENAYRIKLTKRTPVIIRVDGKAFHSFTRGFFKPYDMVFKTAMWETARYLCKNIMNAKMAYVQSDEISLLLIDYNKLTTESWFDNNVQKMCSVSASMATLAFNKAFADISLSIDPMIQFFNTTPNYDSPSDREEVEENWKLAEKYGFERNNLEALEKQVKIYRDALDKYAMFDSRVFNIPESEICNYFLWRQNDATRNSIQMAGRCYFSDKQLNNLNCNQIQEKLFQERSINWNNYPDFFKKGVCIIKSEDGWDIDKNIPKFSTDRNYIEQYLIREEE